MTADMQRELAEALRDKLVETVGSQMPPGHVWNLDKVTDGLLPLIADAEKRAAAQALRPVCGCEQGMGHMDRDCHSYGLCHAQSAERAAPVTSQADGLREAARGWILRHSSQPDGDRWRDNPSHLDWAAENLLSDLAPWIGAAALDPS